MRSILRVFVLSTIVSTGFVSAQQPQVLNAQLTSQAADRGLKSALDSLKQSTTPLWVGYVIPTASRFRGDWNSSQVSYLEKHDYSEDQQNNTSTTEQDHAAILFRLEAGKIDKVRAEAVDRQIDAGGLRFVWLSNITPEDSIGVLKTIALAQDSTRLLNSAVFLISLHRSDAASTDTDCARGARAQPASARAGRILAGQPARS